VDIGLLTTAWTLIRDYGPEILGGSGLVFAVRGIALAYVRRPKSTTSEVSKYFTDENLLRPPLTRPAYSDRMAYVLAEMAELAYYQFEGQGGVIDDAVDKALSLNLTEADDVRAFLDCFSVELMSGRRLSRNFLERILRESGFCLLDVISVDETQGFVCKRATVGEPPYLVLAFRGTEKKVSDWLTDVRCVPTVVEETKVHTGFIEAFTKKRDDEGRTVEQVVNRILDRADAKDEGGNRLPLFITGHSLGGALALLATKLVASDVDGACYTFGAPRVGNYEYFRKIKTPVYRIVNSADVVPRVPPGPFMIALRGAAQAISWLTDFIPGAARFFDKVEEFLDKLNGYRHYGDLRYLSDVSEGQFQKVRLLMNPPAADRVVWAFRRLARSLLVPVKCHNMNIYRQKLRHVANDRNQE